MNTTSVSLLIFSFSWIALAVVLHVLSYRLIWGERGPRSPQGFLVKLILGMNLFLLPGVLTVARDQARTAWETILMLVFVFLVVNSFLYAYFHFFNMSETARRIRILLQLRLKGVLQPEEMREDYSPVSMVKVRLNRLVETGQIIKRSDDQYYIANFFLLRVALFIAAWRSLLGFKQRRRENV